MAANGDVRVAPGMVHVAAVDKDGGAAHWVLNPIWAFVLVNERPGPWALAGGSIIVAATLWRTLAPAFESRPSWTGGG